MTLRSFERGFERQTTASAQGEYSFDLVSPGRFTVLAEHAGFATTTAQVDVVVATPVSVNMVLHIQSVQEQIKVLGEGGVSVQAENAGLGSVYLPP